MPIIFGLVQNNSVVISPGTIQPWGSSSTPAGWLSCDGSLVSQTIYAALFSAVNGAFGISGGFFNLPDLRGRFLRGVSGASTNDPNRTTRTAMNTGGNAGNAVGSVQGNATAKNGLSISVGTHFHYISNYANSDTGSGAAAVGEAADEPSPSNTDSASSNVSLTGDSETRPLNAYVQFIIKY